MPHTKAPEKTVEAIVAAAKHLFLKNGYMQTTIDDITGAVGMTKGAFYHHFSSKEEVLDEINEHYATYQNYMEELAQDNSRTGLARLHDMLVFCQNDEHKVAADAFNYACLGSAQFALRCVRNAFDCATDILPMFIAGKADGSLQIENPLYSAELFLLTLNLWTTPYVQNFPKEEFVKRMYALSDILAHNGIPVLTEDLMAGFIRYYGIIGIWKN